MPVGVSRRGRAPREKGTSVASIGGFSRLADFSLRRRRAILVVAGLFTAIAAVLGMGVTGHLTQGGSDAPSQESVRAADVLASQFHTGDSNFLVLVDARHGTVDGASVVAAGDTLTARLRHEPGVTGVESYWSLGQVGAMANKAKTEAIIVARIEG